MKPYLQISQAFLKSKNYEKFNTYELGNSDKKDSFLEKFKLSKLNKWKTQTDL